MADLKDKVVLVIDASGTAGRGIAEGLAEAGATLYLISRPTGSEVLPGSGSVEETVVAVEALGGRVVSLQIDHADHEALLELFRRVESEAGRLDVLINNVLAAQDPAVRSASFWEQPFNLWEDQCGTGLQGCFITAALAARLMVEQGDGLIVNLSGGASISGKQLSVAGAVLEAGVQRMAAAMAHELRPFGVTALALDPGPVRPATVISTRDQRVIDGRLRSPRFVGRALAALAMDPDVHEKTGGSFHIEALRSEYRFSELSAPIEIAEAPS